MPVEKNRLAGKLNNFAVLEHTFRKVSINIDVDNQSLIGHFDMELVVQLNDSFIFMFKSERSEQLKKRFIEDAEKQLVQISNLFLINYTTIPEE